MQQNKNRPRSGWKFGPSDHNIFDSLHTMSAGRVSWLEAIGKRRHEPVPISPQSGEIFPAAGSKKKKIL